MSYVVPIKAAALPAWLALQAALAEAARPVCVGTDAHLWTSEAAEDREVASSRCGSCPIDSLCASYADAAREHWGVWAGVDRTRNARQPKGRQTMPRSNKPKARVSEGDAHL